jgi:hypothetical protein
MQNNSYNYQLLLRNLVLIRVPGGQTPYTPCLLPKSRKMALRLKSPTAILPPFSFSPPTSPSSSSDDPKSPQAALLPASEMHIFGLQPLEPDIGNVSCAHCHKPVLKSAILEHTGEDAWRLSTLRNGETKMYRQPTARRFGKVVRSK